MKLQSFVLLQASTPSFLTPKSTRWGDKNPNFFTKLVHFTPVKSRKSLGFQPCCCSSSDFGEEQFDGEGIGRGENEGFCAIFESKGSVFPSKFEFLDPSMLGIKPEPPCWPEREAILWANIEQKAKNFGLPLSLRMLQKKHQWKSGRFKDLKESNSCTSKAFSSLVSIIVELQTCALHMRESMCNEHLDIIISKVQRDMYASYVWLFRQVFSRTPTLMMYVMILLANYSVHCASNNVAIAKPLLQMASDKQRVKINYPPIVPQEQVPNLDDKEMSDEEKKLWESLQDEVLNMRGLKGIGFDHEIMLKFVSPLKVEIEPDNTVDYYKTDFVYQMALSYEPYNTLFLCNYAQFLNVIVRDYDR